MGNWCKLTKRTLLIWKLKERKGVMHATALSLSVTPPLSQNGLHACLLLSWNIPYHQMASSPHNALEPANISKL